MKQPETTVVECSINCGAIILPYNSQKPFEIALMSKDENGKILKQGYYIRMTRKGTLQTIKK